MTVKGKKADGSAGYELGRSHEAIGSLRPPAQCSSMITHEPRVTSHDRCRSLGTRKRNDARAERLGGI